MIASFRSHRSRRSGARLKAPMTVEVLLYRPARGARFAIATTIEKNAKPSALDDNWLNSFWNVEIISLRGRRRSNQIDEEFCKFLTIK